MTKAEKQRLSESDICDLFITPAIKGAGWDQLTQIRREVLIPPCPLLDAMTHTMSPIIDQIIANRTQSRTLATLRDTLLPKLLSGELIISN